jgi:fructosamine-3-kinase
MQNVMSDTNSQPDSALTDFMARSGLVGPGVPARFTALTGGVSSDIWKVETDARVFVVKRALAQLRVAREWMAPVSRNASEVDWMLTAGAVVPEAVPKVLAHDTAAGAFAMAFLDPADHPVWKAELLAGRADPAFAANVGLRIAAIHNATAGDTTVARRFDTDAAFHALRLEPYLEASAAANPDVAAQLMALSRDTLKTKRALVHGDVSPKNILVGLRGPVFLDAECAWYGDPAFDLAFCLNHLLLKMVVVTAARAALAESFTALAGAYLDALTHEPRAAAEARTARLLPALMLARIDGKSPVEYITEEGDKALVRDFARPLVAAPPPSLASIVESFAETFAA